MNDWKQGLIVGDGLATLATMPNPDTRAVTQEDREAAAFADGHTPGDAGWISYTSGRSDQQRNVQTFARHRLAAQADADARVGEWPAKWSGDLTVGNMIANLRTLPADMPIHAAYHVIREGKPGLLFVKHPTVSRERVDGRTIKTGDESVPYSAVIWTQPRDPDALALALHTSGAES